MAITRAIPATLREAELLELLDDLAAILQNPGYYGVQLLDSRFEGDRPGVPFRARALARLAEISPALSKEEEHAL